MPWFVDELLSLGLTGDEGLGKCPDCWQKRLREQEEQVDFPSLSGPGITQIAAIGSGQTA